MVTRSYNQAKTTKKMPTKPLEWTRLMQTVIKRADTVKDRRAGGLRKALATGKAEALLRRMGIISEIDLLREFPEKVK